MLNQLIQKVTMLLLVVGVSGVMAQQPGRQPSARQEAIEVLSPKGVAIGEPGQISYKYMGNVKLRHQGALLFCDQVVHQVTANRLDAVGHVLVVQGDTIIIKADTLIYLGGSRQAVLRGRVTFQDRRIILNAAQLDYNLSSGMAHYASRGRLVDSRIVLTSREGYYDTRSRQIELQRTVRLVSPDNTLTAEAMIYNTVSRLATLVEPTRITGKDGVSVAQQGEYDTQNGVLQQNDAPEKLKYAGLTDSLDRITYAEPVEAKHSATGLIKRSKLAASSPVLVNPASGGARIATERPATKPGGVPATILPTSPTQQADTTQIVVGSLVVEAPKNTPESKSKATTRNLATAGRKPLKRDETASEAATLVLTKKPDEQVILATTDASIVPATKQEAPVLVTTANPQPLTTVAQQPPAEKEATAKLAKQPDTITISSLAAEASKNVDETAAKLVDKAPLSPVSQPAVAVPPKAADVVTVGLPEKKPDEPVKSSVAEIRTEGSITPAVRRVIGPPSGQKATIRVAIVTPVKRIIKPTASPRVVPDPNESDLERELNRKKRSN